MKLYATSAAALSLIMLGYAHALTTPKAGATVESEIARVSDELSNIQAERQKAINIDPTYGKGFDRKITEKQQQLLQLKAGLSS